MIKFHNFLSRGKKKREKGRNGLENLFILNNSIFSFSLLLFSNLQFCAFNVRSILLHNTKIFDYTGSSGSRLCEEDRLKRERREENEKSINV